MSENKRAGREDELRKKIKDVIERYETVFGTPLTTEALKSFLDYSEAHNRNTFLTDRIGVLSDMDVNYLRNVLSENTKGTKIKDPLPDVDALNGLDDVDSDEIEELEDLSA